MTQANAIQHFLSGMAGQEKPAMAQTKQIAMPFVTISRQAGAGGHTLAEALVNAMAHEPDQTLFHGWQIFDQQLCEMVARDSSLQVSMQSLLTEEYRSQIQTFILGLLSGQPDQNEVMRKLFETIRSLAKVGKVIIVGRAGSQVTKKLPLGIHVRLVAPEPLRIKRMSQLLRKSEGAAKRTMQQQDKDRARLLKSFFYADIDDALHYDCVWNTGLVPFETIAAATIVLLKQRVKDRTQSA